MCRKEEDMSSYVEGQINQLANAFESKEFTPEDITKLGQSKGILIGLRGVLRGTHEIKPVERPEPEKEKPKSAKPLLGPAVDIITIPDRTSNFVVQKDFAKYRGGNFDGWFIGKVEEAITGAVLRAQPLLRSSTDPAIIAELGGNLKARITLADINHAEKNGALRKNVVYMGYVEDIIRFPADEAFSYINEKGEKCVLRAVYFRWRDDGWDAYARSVVRPFEWIAGSQVFSRNSVS